MTIREQIDFLLDKMQNDPDHAFMLKLMLVCANRILCGNYKALGFYRPRNWEGVN